MPALIAAQVDAVLNPVGVKCQVVLFRYFVVSSLNYPIHDYRVY